MFQHLFTLLISLICAGGLSAQGTHLVETDRLALRTGGYVMDLKKLPFTITEFADATDNLTGVVGTGYRKNGRQPIGLYFPDGLDLAVQDLLDKARQPRNRPTAIFQLRRVLITEQPKKLTEYRRVELTGSVAISTPEGYRLVGPLTYVESSGSFNVTVGHDYAFYRTLEGLLLLLGEASATETGMELTELPDLYAQRLAGRPDTSAWSDLPDGFYASYEDFLQQRVDTSREVRSRSSRTVATLPSGDAFDKQVIRNPWGLNNKEMATFWGAHYAGRPYVRHRGDWYALSYDDARGLTAALPVVDGRKINGYAIAVGAVLGGIPLGLLAAVLTRSNKIVYNFHGLDPVTGRPLLVLPATGTEGMIVRRLGGRRAIKLFVHDGEQQHALKSGRAVVVPLSGEVCFSLGRDEEVICMPVEDTGESVQMVTLRLVGTGVRIREETPGRAFRAAAAIDGGGLEAVNR